jgi:hypothetical protein
MTSTYASAMSAPIDSRQPEVILAELMRRDLGVDIHPQALRMFLRCRWDRVSPLAHKINDGVCK